MHMHYSKYSELYRNPACPCRVAPWRLVLVALQRYVYLNVCHVRHHINYRLDTGDRVLGSFEPGRPVNHHVTGVF